MIRPLVRHLAWVLTLVALATSPPRVAHAAPDPDEWQLGNVRDYDYWWFRTPPALIPPREAERLAGALALTDHQAAAFEAMVLGAERDFEDDWLALAESFDDLRWGGDARYDRDWRARRRQMREIHRQGDAALDGARGAILADLQIILTGEQAAAWDRAMRDHRRRMTLAEYANINGETVDIVSIVELIETLSDQQRDALDAELETYAIEIDAALSSRRAARESLERACRRLDDSRMSERQVPGEELNTLQEEVIRQALRTWDASRRIRQVNERYSTVIGDMLGPTERQRLKELTAVAPLPGGEYASMPRGLRMLRYAENLDAASDVARAQGLYDNSRWTLSMAAAAAGVEPLTERQREAIALLKEHFEGEYARLRREHDIPDFQTYGENHIQVRCDEGRVELQRRKPVDSRGDGRDWRAYNEALGRISDETVEKLRDLLTVRQRILLQTRE